jgi:hypothetical protein
VITSTMMDGVRTVGRAGAVAAMAVLVACSDARAGSAPDQPGTSLAQQSVITTTTAGEQVQPVLHGLGEPFTVGDVRLTVVSVQDPFPASAGLQPVAGNRLVSIKYEAVSLSAASQHVSDLPPVALLDSTGTSYESEHGRLSMVAGGKSMEASVLFEIPASATGLRVAFRTPAATGPPAAVVAVD